MRNAAAFPTRSLFFVPLLACAAALAADKPPAETETPAQDIVSPGPTSLPELETVLATEALITASADQPLFIFKHSTQCPISAAASDRLSAYVKEVAEKDAEGPRFVWVKVIESRPVSKFLEERFEVKHESPQILLVHDRKVVWHTSHEKITADAMTAALKALESEDEAAQQ